ncbi:MAG: hypothetical protein HUU17_08755 [Chthonomonadales bacterium]|nr:hypothetical protein [Chthonomonadales bacterium]
MNPADEMSTRRYSRREQGQSLLVAVIALFVLLFIGGLFVGLVARNLMSAGRSRETIAAAALADGGIRYVSDFLETSPEGADWRPEPTPLTDARDPDRRWLETGAFTRVSLARGRALVRVSLSPNPQDPTGKYLRIEAVGRPGFVDSQDPTTFTNSPAPRLMRRRVAYKAIGLTDYLRYVTNRDRESKFEAAIGMPPIGVPAWMQLGGMPVRAAGMGGPPAGYSLPGAPMYINGDLHLLNNVTLALNPGNHETVYVAGKVKVEPGDPNDPARQTARINDLGATNSNAEPLPAPFGSGAGLPAILPSDAPTFTTYGGLLRDASMGPDVNGYARSISRLDPPSLEAADPASGVSRYLALTRDSGRSLRRLSRPGWVNTGRIGLGSGVYINNPRSRELETTAVSGGQSLRSVWLRPGSSAYWNGPYYIPPAAYIEFGYPIVQERTTTGAPIPGSFVRQPGFRIVRDVSDAMWVDPSGRIRTREQVFTFFIYKGSGQRPVLKLDNALYREFLATDQGMTDVEINRFLPEFNGVLYAEGNVRVRGLLPSVANIPIRQEAGDTDGMTPAAIRDAVNPPAISLVSGRNIYIEGSIVREAATGPNADKNAGSMIALLAHEYVVVNTTMFMAPNKAMQFAASNQDEIPPYHTNINVGEAAATPPFTLDFMFGDDPSAYTLNGGPYLLLRHGAPPGVTYLNLAVNESFPPAAPADAYYRFNAVANPPVPPAVYPMYNGSLAGVDLFEQRGFAFPFGGTSYSLFTAPGVVNTIRPIVDPNFTSGSGTQDYLFSRAAVVPMDVRIEALIYAQNGSFFIIPGYPFNVDPSDTRDAAVRRHAASGAGQGSMLRPQGTADEVPFYGEPIDCRITIVGAISENRTASISDQAAWMQLWGYIPQRYGSTGLSPTSTTPSEVPTEHLFATDVGLSIGNPAANDHRAQIERAAGITRGLRMIYDPALGAPYSNYNPGGGTYYRLGGWAHVAGGSLRQDDLGRALPPLPRLPVCPGFVYFGEDR